MMPYLRGPYSRHASLPVPPRPLLGAAREIDFVTKRYVTDEATGGFSHMPPTVQRVVILSFQVKLGEFNTLPERNRYSQGLRDALEPLLTSSPPLIDELEIEVTSPAPDTIYKLVRFRDISDSRRPVVEVQLP